MQNAVCQMQSMLLQADVQFVKLLSAVQAMQRCLKSCYRMYIKPTKEIKVRSPLQLQTAMQSGMLSVHL